MASKKKLSPPDAPIIDLAAHVYPPYRGEATHPDPKRLIVPISVPVRDPINARLHDEKNIRQIRASLRRRGQQTPLNLDRHGRILKGNGTIEAAEQEGWGYIWISVSELEGAEATAYAISDNATGLSSKWDFEQLAENISTLKEFDGSEMEFSNDDLGFDEHEITPLLAADWQPPSAQEDQPAEAPKKKDADAGRDPHEDLEEGDKANDSCSITCTPNMRVMIDRAIERVRLMNGELSLTEGRCIELICADFLSDPNNDVPAHQQIQED